MAELVQIMKPLESNVKQNVIFIHGLEGNLYKTWRTLEDEHVFWPSWLAGDIMHLSVWTVGYAASASRWSGSSMHFTDRSTNILELLLSESELKSGEIILVGHSMGGLIIKQLLITANSMSNSRKDAADFVDRVRRVAFIATPHEGAGLATIADRARIFFRPSSATASLVRRDPNLRNLNNLYREWSDHNKIDHLILVENESEGIFGQIVSHQSADPGLVTRPILIDANHSNICKPENQSSAVYKFIKNFISKESNTMHSNISTRKSLEEHNAKLDQLLNSAQKQPTQFIDAEIYKRLKLIKRARFFPEFPSKEESLRLADQILDGDLAYGSNVVKSTALAWCARILSVSEYRLRSDELIIQAKKFGNGAEIIIAEIFKTAAIEGYAEALLSKLTSIESPEANSAALMLINNQPDLNALEWFKRSALSFSDLDSDGKIVLLGKLIEQGDWGKVIEYVDTLDDNCFSQAPALLQFAAIANLEQAVPDEFQTLITTQVPFEVKTFPLASSDSALHYRRKAQDLFEQCSYATQELDLNIIANIASDYALWLELRDPEMCHLGRKKLEESMRDKKHSLRRLRFALDFGLDVNISAVENEIDRQIALSGGKSIDAAYARFSLIFMQQSHQDVLDYIELYRSEIESNLNKKALNIIEVEALAHVGATKKAEDCLNQLITDGLSSDIEIKRLRNIIDTHADTNPVEAYRIQYEESKSITDLNNLITLLEKKNDWIQLYKYSSLLFERTISLSDAERLATVLNETTKYTELEDLLENYSGFLEQSDTLLMHWSWILYRKGLLIESKVALKKLQAKRSHSADRSLEINLAITSGDWEALSTYIESEWVDRDHRSTIELMHSAKLAHSLGSSRTKDLLQSSVEKANDDPGILAEAYFLATRAGWEDEVHAAKWLNTATRLSTGDGPLKHISLEELSEQIPEWNNRDADNWQKVYEGKTPLFIAAHLMNKTLLDFFVLPALLNPSEEDIRRRQLIPAYSGERKILPCSYQVIGIDATSLLTLAHLDLLGTASNFFKTIYIPHSTLGWLFEEKQKVTFHQPSRIKEATIIRGLLAEKKLLEFQSTTTSDSNLVIEVGEELSSLIAEAQIDDDNKQKLVIKAYPAHRINSFMKEEADLSAYYSCLCSCLSLVKYLKQKAQITATDLERATSYLKLRDKEWPDEPIIKNNAVLYLDDLSVTYLQHLGMLDKLSASGLEVYISERVIEEINRLLRYERLSSLVDEKIDLIRRFLSQGIKNGKIKITKISDIDEKDQKILKYHPTFELIKLAEEQDVDAIVIDDRSLNQHIKLNTNVTEKPLLTSLDIIHTFHSNGNISLDQMFEYKTKLRQYGYLYIPITQDELNFHLTTADVGGHFTETAELKAIRENLLCIRMSLFLQLPNEAYWLNSIMQTLTLVLKKQWEPDIDKAVSIAKSEWILDLLDLRGWAHCQNDDSSVWMAKFSRALQLLGLLIVPNHFTTEKQKEYWDWLDSKVLNVLKHDEPEVYAFLLDESKKLIAQQLDKWSE